MHRIAVLTSGGDSPGMNAAIRAVVRAGIHHDLEVLGIRRGYLGLIDDDMRVLDIRSVNGILGRGGTILRSARCPAFRERAGRDRAAANLRDRGVDGLIVIGGDGTYAGAHALYEESGLPVVGLPGTIDNDLFGTDYTIGFDTATNTVVEAVDKIRDTASSHDRLFFVEVMGRDTGFIAVRTGVACGAVEILVPETTATAEDVAATLGAARARGKTSSIVIVAEGDQTGGAERLAEDVSTLTENLYDTRVTVLGHLQRGGSPTCFDRILASELGVAAVEALRDGVTDATLGRERRDIRITPFAEAIGRRKGIDQRLLRIRSILSA